jgi:hypothetical protein
MLRRRVPRRLSSNAVANALPAGGALGMGVSWAMMSSWGISTADYVLYTLMIGIRPYVRRSSQAFGLPASCVTFDAWIRPP